MSASLTQERQRVTFNLNDLSVYIFETEEIFQKITNYYNILSKDPITRNDPTDLGKSRIEVFKLCAKKAHRLHELFNWGGNDEVLWVLDHFDQIMSASVHVMMFIPCIELLGSDEQIKKYLERSRRLEVIGAYAQTELGHGSDVRSLETTATFDPKTSEFVINTPTLTATKWWPGELGFNANHVICYAQLIIGEKNHGVHGFIMQIRDMETNKVLPGMEAGDVGPKYGYNTKDNGFIRFNNVRVGRDSLLGRYAEVTSDGKYIRKGNEKVGYAIMMKNRAHITNHCWKALTMALTIGVRYSLVRTQFEGDDGKERKVLDYQLQQDKLISNLSLAYGMHAGSLKASDMIAENTQRVLSKEDFSLQADTHATLSGTKAIYTGDALFAMETVRMSCGGHGYSSYSGFTRYLQIFNVNPTFEGENSVLALQTARYLLKHLGMHAKGKEISDLVEYLGDLEKFTSGKAKCQATKASDINLEELFQIMRAGAAYAVLSAASVLREGAKEVGPKESWDSKAGSELQDAARAHIYYYTFRAFKERIEKEVKSPQLKVVLEKLCALFALDRVIRYPQSLFESGYLRANQFNLLKKRKAMLLEEIRPEVIGLVDAFGYPDNTLNSAIGSYDGNAYQNMWDWVQNYNDFNKADLSETWVKYIKGFRSVNPPRPKL